MRARSARFVLALALLVALAASSVQVSAQGQAPLKIGLVYSYTGAPEYVGKGADAAIAGAIADVSTQAKKPFFAVNVGVSNVFEKAPCSVRFGFTLSQLTAPLGVWATSAVRPCSKLPMPRGVLKDTRFFSTTSIIPDSDGARPE
jgi:hypothetical protein